MRRLALTGLCAAITSAFIAAGAHAATFTVHFSGNTIPVQQLDFNNAGGSHVDVSVTSRGYNKHNGTLYNNPFKVGQYSGGLGVCSGTVVSVGDYCSGDWHTVDGKNKDEMVLFTFSEQITLKNVSFHYFGNKSDFSFSSYVPSAGYYKKTDIPTNGSYNFAQTWTGTQFGVGAPGNNDYFKIKSLTFHVAPVPLPATGLLLIAGIAGLGVMRRRKRG